MLPFSSNEKPSPVSAILVGDISVRWDSGSGWWEVSDDYYYTLVGNPEFNTATLDNLTIAKRWIADPAREIEAEIKKRLGGRCKWSGEERVLVAGV